MRCKGPAHPSEIIDAGLQSERTYLAWQRTALAFAGVGALLLHGVLPHGVALAVPGGFGLFVGAFLFARAQRRYRLTVSAARSGLTALDRRMMAGVAAAATVLSLAGLGVLLVAG